MQSNSFIELSVSAINCNSMNVSTIGKRNAKTYLKVEGITGKKTDVILISDIRAKDKGEELVKLMGLTRNGSYKLYLNSSKESRGVGIAFKRNIQHEIKDRYIGRGDENVLLLDLEIKGKRITLGVVYGPNGNDQEFFRNIKQKLAQWGNKGVLGGDFNTILSSQGGDQNLDREGIGRVPNVQNSRVLNEWLTNGIVVDPYRAMYPENRVVSYIPFRMRNARVNEVSRYGCTRLDFFLISPDLLDSVNTVSYEDRLGSDFDHKEVILKRGRKSNGSRIMIKDSTLNNEIADDAVLMTVYENLVNNLAVRDGDISGNLAQLNILLREKEQLLGLASINGNDIEFIRRMHTVDLNIGVIKERLPSLRELVGRDFSSNYRILYEGIIMGVKNALLDIQSKLDKMKKQVREQLLLREDYVKQVFGENSQQWFDAREAILRHDDANLKDRANKFRAFLDTNNEKATRAFCRLSKEGGLCDDISQIRGEDGQAFQTSENRGKYISGYYSNVYKKKLDRIMRIEDFLLNGIENQEIMNNRRLDEVERLDLESGVTMDEVKCALDGSNFERSSGWDGTSFRVLRKFWVILCEPMLKMIQETFEIGELMETFKLGLIKLIPKKGDANKIGDWRPITLLCCGYKLISGIVANRIGKYLPKLIGRSQKGFMSNKNINTCTVNVMNSISRSWELGWPTGIMCVDFAKAFDSVEHEMISNVLTFFGFGDYMVKMVSTLLNDRKSRIIFEGGYSEDVIIGRGTPQGDRSSPYIFILCIEILIIRINMLEGRGIDDSGLYVDIVRDIDGVEKLTSETYADDLTIIFRMSENSVEIIL